MRRKRNASLFAFVCIILLILLFVNMILNTKVYFVYSSGMGPLVLMGIILLIIIILFVKG